MVGLMDCNQEVIGTLIFFIDPALKDLTIWKKI